MNWQPFSGSFVEIAQGINLHHAPGHTPGLCVMQINLKDSGTWIATTDMYHVKENWEASQPQGWLARDHDDWVRSHQMIRMLQKRTNAKMILGHCKDVRIPHKLSVRCILTWCSDALKLQIGASYLPMKMQLWSSFCCL